jgi:hypothetical protein
MSWVWALQFFAEADRHDASPWIVDLLMALDRQLTHIEQNLSYYFSPNTHLLGEALALYVCGIALPELAASGRRQSIGRRVLVAEIERQIGQDGGHCERSAHYHRYALDFYNLALIVARLTGDPAAADFDRAVARLAFAARLLADDRGRLPHIGDDDGGMLLPIAGRAADDARDTLATAAALLHRADLQIGPTPEETVWMLGPDVAPPSATGSDPLMLSMSTHECERSAVEGLRTSGGVAIVRSGALAETGYYVSRSTNGDHLVVDAGPHGYQNGGHAHADALSLTFTVRGLPLLIDPGTACYTIDSALRDRFRSSALHNTVTVDDRPQSIPRGPFHWQHTANGRVRHWRTNDAFDYFDGVHDGYRPLEHRRRVLALLGETLIVADLLDSLPAPDERAGSEPRMRHSAAVHWHVSPKWKVEVDGCRAALTTRGESVSLFVPHGRLETFTGDDASGLGWCSPVYGRVREATTIRIAHDGSSPLWVASVFDLNGDNPIRHVEWLPVWAEAGALAEAAALRIDRANGTDYTLFAERAADATANATGAPRAARADHRSATWRIGEFETDARMLFCRVDANGHVVRVALVDGSLVRAGRRRLQLALPRVAPDLHLDLSGDARVAGPAFGARLIVGGLERPIAIDRRAGPRA